MVFVFNLAPRKMLGLDSQGMLLTIEDNQNKIKPIIVSDVANGTQLK
jgi:tRNA-binding EMAP/Myf-like protein